MKLVVGATGNVGNKLVHLLAEQGHEVRALVRDPVRARFPEGVEVVVGDLDNPASINVAAKGVDAIFHMQASPLPTQTETVIAAAHAVGVERLVALTSMGAVLAPAPTMGTFFQAREDLLRASGLAVTFLRPNGLMSNALWWRDSIRENGTVSDPCGEGRVPVVDTDDVAAVAAAVSLTQPGHEGHGYLLTGPEALTSREQVEILADVLGQPITFVDVSPRRYAGAGAAHGTPPQMVPVIEDLYTVFRAGRVGVLTDDVRTSPAPLRGPSDPGASATSATSADPGVGAPTASSSSRECYPDG